MKYPVIIISIFMILLSACSPKVIDAISEAELDEKFEVIDHGELVTIIYDQADPTLTETAANLLADDIERVSGERPKVNNTIEGVTGRVILIGTVDGSSQIGSLVTDGKISVSEIAGDWERYIIERVAHPYDDVEEALVIVGSDRRGAAYGVFELSERMGVSPWYYWADVPTPTLDYFAWIDERTESDEPSVKYRGIFLNDEAPALRGWAVENFGDFNHEFYQKVFELLLRNKANYIWPAMWKPAAFAVNDPLNPKIADDYGIVVSTSHHEPMMRAHAEWKKSEHGEWNYHTNKEALQVFWRGGIERNGDYESVVTLGMRGDGDEAMSEETAVDLLQKIIHDQREIITDVTGRPAEETPQVWAIYKEVQDYYDKGMRVDDDIMILFCDDNWGNVRILPKKKDLNHSGGYGMYYHFDFVGGPVSYRWLNVTQIERVYEQMNLAYQWGVEDLWLVNVGDLKPMELPISFFLDMAYDVDAYPAEALPDYYTDWARQQFGFKYAEEIGEILSLTTKYAARRTPEMIKPDTWSLTNYNEAERILTAYRELMTRSENMRELLPAKYQDAYYQLVHAPISFFDNLNKMYVAVGKNHLYAEQGRASTNDYADLAQRYFDNDKAMTEYFHTELADGKWNHMMAQTRIGYTSWDNPRKDIMPEVKKIEVPKAAKMGVQLEQNVMKEGVKMNLAELPTFDQINDQRYYIEIYNKGQESFDYQINANKDWVNISQNRGTITTEQRVLVSIDWDKAPSTAANARLKIAGSDEIYTINISTTSTPESIKGHIENNGVISIEAHQYSRKESKDNIQWITVPNLGRTASSMTIDPADAPRQDPMNGAPSLEYDFTLIQDGAVELHTYLSPTLNYQKNEGLKYAVAIDDETPQIINMHEGEVKPDWEYPKWWNDSVTDHIKIKTSAHGEYEAGVHTLKIWMVDPGVVVQKFVIDTGGLRESYLGPPESKIVK